MDAETLLAIMTFYAPSYDVTVEPFARAHQEACRLLAELKNELTPNQIRELAMGLPEADR